MKFKLEMFNPCFKVLLSFWCRANEARTVSKAICRRINSFLLGNVMSQLSAGTGSLLLLLWLSLLLAGPQYRRI